MLVFNVKVTTKYSDASLQSASLYRLLAQLWIFFISILTKIPQLQIYEAHIQLHFNFSIYTTCILNVASKNRPVTLKEIAGHIQEQV